MKKMQSLLGYIILIQYFFIQALISQPLFAEPTTPLITISANLQEVVTEESSPEWLIFKEETCFRVNGFFETSYKNDMGLGRNDEIRLLKTNKPIRLPANSKRQTRTLQSFRLQQYYKGIPVEFAECRAVEVERKMTSCNCKVTKDLDLNTQAQLNPDDAIQIALKQANSKLFAFEDEQYEKILQEVTGERTASFCPKAELVILTSIFKEALQKPTLAYKIDVFSIAPLSREWVYIDAQTGTILDRISQIHHDCEMVEGSGETNYNGIQNFEVESFGQGFRLGSCEPDIRVFDARGLDGYPPFDVTSLTSNFDHHHNAVDVYWGANETVKILQERFNWISYDNEDGKIMCWIKTFSNAFYNGGWFVFGSGDGENYNSFTPLDIVAHEISHAITDHTASLVYRGESGAINESFSDIMGMIVECYVRYGGIFNEGTWLIGEDTTINGMGFRSMSHPNDYKDPHTYEGNFYRPTNHNCNFTNDWCGVHSNSGIMNYVFYLLVNGENGVNDHGYSYQVSGIGLEEAAQIVFHAMTNHLQPTSNFFDAQQAMLTAAEDLYGDGNQKAQTEAAWCAVGIGACQDLQNKTLTISRPDSLEVFVARTIEPITWTSTGDIPTVHLLYSINGTEYISIAENIPNTGNYEWIVPEAHTTIARVKLIAADEPSVFDISNYRFTIQNEVSCQLTANFTLPNPDNLCTQTPIDFLDASSGTITSKKWFVNEQLVNESDNQLQYTFEEGGTYRVKLEISNSEDCSDTYEKTIYIATKPNTDFGYTSNNNLSLNFTAQYTTASDYSWTLEEEIIASTADFYYTFPSIGTYTICLSLSNDCGENSDCKEVNVKIEEECGDGTEVNHFTQYTNGGNATVLAEDGEYIWVGTSDIGLIKIHKTQGKVAHYSMVNSPLPSNHITAIAVADDGIKWLGTANDGIVRFKEDSWDVFNNFNASLPSNKVFDISINGSNIWFALDKGFSKYDGTKWDNHTTFNIINLSSNPEIEKIEADNKNNVWMLTASSELIKFDDSSNKNEVVYYDDIDTAVGTIQDLVFDPIKDKLWMPSFIDGVICLDVNSNEFLIYDNFNSNLDNGPKYGLQLDNNGKIWLSSTFSLYKFNNQDWIEYDLPVTVLGDNPFLISQEDNIWIWTPSRKLYHSSLSEEWEYVNISDFDFPIDNINCLYFEGNNTLWIATDNSLVKANLNNEGTIIDWFIYDSNNSPVNFANSVVVDDMGWIWVTGGYLKRLVGVDQWTIFDSESVIPISTTYDIIADNFGNKWMGTNTGLVKITTSGPTIYNLTDIGNLAFNNTIADLAFDDEGNLWVSSSLGLAKFDGIDNLLVFNTTNSILPHNGVDDIAIHGNNIWVNSYFYVSPTTSYDKLTCFKEEEEIEVYSADNSPIGYQHINDITIDSKNNKWIGYQDKILKLSFDETWTVYTTGDGYWNENTNSNPDFIGGGSTEVIAVAPDGSIWFGGSLGLLHLKTETSGIKASFNLNQMPCATNPYIIQSSSIGGNEFAWFINNQEVSTQKDLHYTFNEPGTYIIRHTVSDGPDCTDSHTETLTVHPSSGSLNPTPSEVLECIAENTPIQIELSAGVEGMETYTWTLNGDSVVSTHSNFTATESGTYTIEVQDQCGGVHSMDVEVILDDECVFPGDINYDGIVNEKDIVAFGLTFSGTGPTRKFASLDWTGQACLNWEALQEDSVNYKHADADGSGLIDLNDFEAIKTNWLKQHNFDPKTQDILSPISLKADITAIPNLTEGGTLKMDIVLDHEFKTPVSVHGLAFEIQYALSGETIQEPTVLFEDSELGTKDDDLLTHAYYDAINQKSLIGLTRFDNQNKRVQNKVTTVLMEIEPVPSVDSLQLFVSVENVFMVNSEGTAIPVAKQNSEVTILGKELGIEQLPTLENYRIYPNPVQDKFTLELSTEQPEQVEFSLHSLTGQEVWSQNRTTVNQAIREEVDMLNLPNGIYFLKIQIGTDYLVEKIVKQ